SVRPERPTADMSLRHLEWSNMTDEQQSAPLPEGGSERRPVDLGLIEGKAMGYLPTSALAPDGPPIGGLSPAGPGIEPDVGGDGGPASASSNEVESAPTQNGSGED